MNAASRQSSTVESGFEMGPPQTATDMLFSESDIKVLCDAKCFQNNPIACWRSPYLAWFLYPFVLLRCICFSQWSCSFGHQNGIIKCHSISMTPFQLSSYQLPWFMQSPFRFALQDTIEKLKDVTNVINDHASAIKQIALLTYESPCYSKSQKLDILVSLKNSTLFWMRTKFMKEAVVKPLCDGMLESYWSIFFNFH